MRPLPKAEGSMIVGLVFSWEPPPGAKIVGRVLRPLPKAEGSRIVGLVFSWEPPPGAKIVGRVLRPPIGSMTVGLVFRSLRGS